ncbi:MAG: DUF3472 domain-containing protein [Rikenellaceae bacterium]
MNKIFTLLILAATTLSCTSPFNPKVDTPYSISMDGNTYITEQTGPIRLGDRGITSWRSDSKLSLFFKPDTTGELIVAMSTKNSTGVSVINVAINDSSFDVTINSSELDTILVGKLKLTSNDYVEVKFTPISKEGDTYADIAELFVGGSATGDGMTYVKDFSTYWGRRGPSVHMGYELPTGVDTEYFYNEVTVAEGNDVIGSYYMANGFGEGYFGMQVNSADERRILFSVWSPFDTQDPKLIPEEDRIEVLRRGEDVYIGEFGNEGSGGQSFLRYNWKAGNTYKFLTKITPSKKGSTTYTAYFYATDEECWKLIAEFKRPKTNTYYKGAHSFLENFSPNQGYLPRSVEFSNQWALDTKGKWHEVTNGRFTHDATASAGVRKDYAGGVREESNSFFLSNCGFFNESTKYLSKFQREAKGKEPQIDFKALEKL